MLQGLLDSELLNAALLTSGSTISCCIIGAPAEDFPMNETTSKAQVPSCPYCDGKQFFRSRRSGLKDWFFHMSCFKTLIDARQFPYEFPARFFPEEFDKGQY